ncbi:hypothetical protein [Streptomyces sp. NPDC001404]|uniref:hypothetical protein n=1 Tax=Streptomyces sp. NPDC001404 TaxID=3364571 RepID=UPI0036B2C9DD
MLRADRIRFDTITGLVAEWKEPGAQDDVEEALERLADVCEPDHDAQPAAVDAAVEAVEAAACMGGAQLEISWRDAVRLRDELDALIRLHGAQFGRPAGFVPQQRAEQGDAA